MPWELCRRHDISTMATGDVGDAGGGACAAAPAAAGPVLVWQFKEGATFFQMCDGDWNEEMNAALASVCVADKELWKDLSACGRSAKGASRGTTTLG